MESEQAAGRYSQPYTPSELEALIGPFRTSPIGLTPKPNSSKFRLIQDLSFPRNHPTIQSVNAGISSDDFPTAWGTFETTAALILSLPQGCQAATFDISAAYRLTPVRPDQQNALCLFWDGKVRVDRAVMFGLTSSAGVFGCVADMLIDIYITAGFGPLTKWVDDFFVIRLPECSWTESDFIDLTAAIGIPWSMEKLRPLSHIQRYIGFDWNLVTKTVSVPPEKASRIQALLHHWVLETTKVTEHEAASLHGKLVHISCIYPLIRPFLRTLSHFSHKFKSFRALLRPPGPVIADLHWIISMLETLPNELPLMHSDPIDLDWWGDASTSFGIGVTIRNFWAVWQWAPGVKVGPKQRFDIGWAEAAAVELALLLAISEGFLSPGHYLVRSDNSGVVAALNNGRSRSRETNVILKNIFIVLAQQRVRLTAIYVPSRSNVVDALSRGDVAAFLKGFPQAHTHSIPSLPDHLSQLIVPFQ